MDTLYSQAEPRPSLRPYVRRIMLADSAEPIDLSVRPGPTGYNYLGWIFAGTVGAVIGGVATPPFGNGLHVAGQIRFQDITVRYRGALGHVLAEFTPTGFYELLPLTGDAFMGAAAPLMPQAHPWTAPFHDAVPEERPDDPQAVLEDFLETLVPTARPVAPYVHSAAARIEDAKGLIRISALAEELGVSARQLGREFQRVTGVTPKYFSRIVQLNHAVTALMGEDASFLTALAHDLGYADQPHFNRAIRQFLGASPQAFLDVDRRVLTQFLGREG